MSKVTRLDDFARWKRVVSDFEQSGWRVSRPAEHIGLPEGPSIYLLDVASGRQFLVATIEGNIKKDAARVCESGFSHDSAVDSLSGIMGSLVSGEAVFDDDHRRALYLAAEAYVAGTQSFQTAVERGLLPNCSFLVLRYHDHGANCELLRPVLIPGIRVLAPHMVESAAQRALQIDREMHPERFGRAEVIPFRIMPPEIV